MLSKEEFLHLQKLAAISLNDEETVKLGNQLGSIVDFLGNLKDIPTDLSFDNEDSVKIEPIHGVNKYEDVDSLFVNVAHEKINNSIIVNSVVDN